MPDAPAPPGPLRAPARAAAAAPPALAALAAGAALLPGARFAAAGILLGAAAVLAWSAAGRRPAAAPARRGPAVPLFALVLAAACLVRFVPPSPSPTAVLDRAIATVTARWEDVLAGLAAVVRDDPPPAGSDFRWLHDRVRALGPGGGLTLLSADASTAVAWSGWTTPLDPAERARLLDRLDAGQDLLVLRRGLALRLLYARRAPGPERLILAAERALPSEPDPGPLAAGLPGGVRALVRWEALGEGLRAPVGAEHGAPTFWSLVPLMAAPANLAGRVSLGVDPQAALDARRDAARRAAAAFVVAAALAGLAVARRRLALGALAAARLALLAAGPWLARGGPAAAAGPFLVDTAGWPAAAAHLVGTPAAAAVTGACVVAAAWLTPASHRARRRAAGGLLLAAGVAVAWHAAVAHARTPVEVLLGGATGEESAGLLLAALAALPVAGFLLLFRGRLGALAPFWAALAGGAALGAVQAAAIEPAARALAQRDVAPALLGREAAWSAAVVDALRLASPPTVPRQLVPERDAIDLWWTSALGRFGLASGVWKFDRDGSVVDAFLTGLPPVQPEPRLAGGGGAGARPVPERRTLPFLGGESELLLAEVARPEGGSWVAGVLAEPGNLPGAYGTLWSRSLSASTARRPPASPFLTPHIAWFDAAGRLVGSDLDTAPRPRRAAPSAPRWREDELEGRPALVLDIPEHGGTVSLSFFRPGVMARAALVVDRAALCGLVALAALALARFLRGPRDALRALARAVRRTGTHFRAQVPLVLVVAGLLPLVVLGAAARATTERQARLQLVAEAAKVAGTAANMVRDYLSLAAAEPVRLGDRSASWIARSIGADLFAWSGGTLEATSRPDLVRAGRWPERLAGETWEEIASGRTPLVVDRDGGAVPAGSGPSLAVVHAPFHVAGVADGVLSIPLGRAGRRIEENLAAADRALLVSAGLLLALAAVIAARTTRRLVAPLADLESATSRIAGGDFGAPVPLTGYEETRALARAFRSMALSLEEQRRRLERRREAIETLIAGLPLAVVAIAGDGTVWAANPRAAALLGAAPGRPLPEGDDPLAAAVRRLAAAQGERVDQIEREEDARARHFRAAGIDLPGLVEDAPARLIVVEDVTDAVRSERLAAWAEMARRIAHEIKNPLTPISLVVDHVRRLREQDDPRVGQVLDRALATIADQVRVLKETAREFSDYARLLAARPEPVDLARSLREWLAPYEIAPPAGVLFRAVGPEALPPFAGDPRLLRRAVVNLVDNALAAVDGGGAVTVTWSASAAPEAAVRVAVEDDGPGIEPSRVPRLFETGETTRETGSGLGLPIALQAAVAHGGRIDVETRPGGGSRFTIVLPLPGA